MLRLRFREPVLSIVEGLDTNGARTAFCISLITDH